MSEPTYSPTLHRHHRRKHAISRAWERYALHQSEAQLLALEGDCRAGKLGITLHSPRAVEGEITCSGVVVRVVYVTCPSEPAFGEIVTFLPRRSQAQRFAEINLYRFIGDKKREARMPAYQRGKRKRGR